MLDLTIASTISAKDFMPVRLANSSYLDMIFEHVSESSFIKMINSFMMDIAISGNGFFDGVYDVYRSTFAGKIINLSSNFLGTGVNMLVKAFTQKRENQANWYSTVQRK